MLFFYSFVAESPFSQWNDARSSSYSLQEEPARLLHGFAGGTDKTKPKFYPGVFSECSTTCGPGVRTRTVECIAFQGLTSNVIKLPDYECEGEQKPSNFQPCQIQQCPDSENDVRSGSLLPTMRGNYRWDYGDWSPCSASCLGGRQKSSLKCIDMTRKTSVPWSHCDAKQRPVDLWRDCNKEPCPPSWDVGTLGECSHTCGGGIRTRKVRCIRHMASSGEAESTLILPDAQCPSPKPFHQEPCGLEDCGATWRVEQWSPCSASCGSGEQRRSVICEQRTAGGLLRIFNPPNECSAMERPPTVQLCNLGSCDSNSLYSYDVLSPSSAPLIRQYSDESISNNKIESNNNNNFEQNNQNHRKLTLNVGGIANLYEGTSIKVKCPVRGFDRTKIVWTKDGEKLQNNAHLKVSSNGALRIFHARMEDAGIYACFANGARGNVTLHFKHRENEQMNENDINRTKPKQQHTSNNADSENEIDSDLTPTDVDQELLKKVRQSLESLGEYRFIQKLETLKEPGRLKVDYQSGDWSPCSQQECGKPDGAQVRLLKCRIAGLDDGAMAYVEDEICEAYGIIRPPATKACHNPECPEWESNDWTECSASRCIREQTSIQRREVKCIFVNGTVADFGLCSRKDRPKIKKECLNREFFKS
uniref:Ig-like domain-containing protein n=1 Tax=Panagrolaimus superbus TaxID=310955 RepID=A0A914Z7N8_9BILA